MWGCVKLDEEKDVHNTLLQSYTKDCKLIPFTIKFICPESGKEAEVYNTNIWMDRPWGTDKTSFLVIDKCNVCNAIHRLVV